MYTLANKRFGIQLIVFSIVFFVCYMMAAAACLLLIKAMVPGVSAKELASLAYTDARVIPVLKYILPVQTILAFGLPAFIFSKIAWHDSKDFLGLRPVLRLRYVFMGLAVVLCSFSFVVLLAQWNMKIPMPKNWVAAEKDIEGLINQLLGMRSIADFAYMLLCMALLPAVCEELFFRACLQPMIMASMPRKHFWIAILITAIVFALLHMQMQTALPRIFLGAVLGLLYYYCNSIHVSILAHFFYNGSQVAAAYIAAQKGNLPSNDSLSMPLHIGLLSLVACMYLLYSLYKQRTHYYIVGQHDGKNEFPYNPTP